MAFDKPTSDLFLPLLSILGTINLVKCRQRLHLDLMRCLKFGLEMPSKFFWMFMAILVFERRRRPVDLFPCQIQGYPLRRRIIRAWSFSISRLFFLLGLVLFNFQNCDHILSAKIFNISLETRGPVVTIVTIY